MTTIRVPPVYKVLVGNRIARMDCEFDLKLMKLHMITMDETFKNSALGVLIRNLTVTLCGTAGRQESKHGRTRLFLALGWWWLTSNDDTSSMIGRIQCLVDHESCTV